MNNTRVTKLFRSFAVLQVALLLASSGFGLMPLVASANEGGDNNSNNDNQSHYQDHHDYNDNSDGHHGASITIVKQTVGGDGTFDFTGSNSLGAFQITTTDGTGQYQANHLGQGTYAITEAPQDGWDQTSATCSNGDDPSAVTINHKGGDGQDGKDGENDGQGDNQDNVQNNVQNSHGEHQDKAAVTCTFVNTKKVVPPPQCDADTELVQNGSFEAPVVADNGGTWQLYPNATPLLSWIVNFVSGNPSPLMEIQHGYSGWLASNGAQFVELDSTEPTMVSQDVPTVVGQTYTLSYDFSARPDTAAADNSVDVLVNGVFNSNIPATATGANTTWASHTVTFTATTATTNIAFRDAGTPSDSLGSFVDNVSMRCVPPPPADPVCTDGQQLVNHECVPIPPVDPICDEGQQLVDHECVPIPPVDPTCPTGQHLDSHECVVDTNDNGGNGGGGSTPTPDITPHGGGGGGGGVISGALSYGFQGGNGGGFVLGTSTEATCGPLLTKFLRIGRKNDSTEVKKLQNFLNGTMNAGLTVDGIFGQSTFNAVSNFQVANWQEVLNPWVPHGLPTNHTATGYVYKTTQRQINLLYCKDLSIPMPNLP